MVQMVFFQAAKERKSGIGEVQGIVQPFFDDIALYDAGEQYGRSVKWEHKAGGGGDKKQRENIRQSTADVPAIEGPRVMIPVKGIKPLVEETANDAGAWRETAMQNIAVEKVFDESPSDATQREESYGGPGPGYGSRGQQHKDNVQSVENGERVQAMTSESGLLALVSLKGDFNRALLEWHDGCELGHQDPPVPWFSGKLFEACGYTLEAIHGLFRSPFMRRVVHLAFQSGACPASAHSELAGSICKTRISS